MKNKAFGISPKQKNEYEIYKNRTIRIVYPNNSCLGVVDEICDGYLNLKPSMVQEGLVNPDGTNKAMARIEREIPFRADLSSKDYIEPHREGYLEDLVNSINVSKSSSQTKK